MVVSEVRRVFVSAVSWPRKSYESDEPIRSELFSAERLEQHADSLAKAQTVVDSGWAYYDLAERAASNGRVLLECHTAIAEAARQRRAITPAAEWVLDNFHVFDEQLKNIARECTPRFARALPVLADGHLRDHPQVYGMVWAFVAHTDSRFDADLLRRFIDAYQRVRALTIRELWAVPTILRCVLIENLRRLAARIVEAQIGRRDADELADDLQTRAANGTLSIDDALALLEERKLTRGFVVQFVQRLRYQDSTLAPMLVRLNERLAAEGLTWERLIQVEHASQASANMTVRNLVTSMRNMAAFDWQGFFEEVSVVDACLRGSPAFSGMDFLTRDRYRHGIEELAQGSGRSELEVARLILAKARQGRPAGTPAGAEERGRDPGYYLIAGGRVGFEEEIGYKPSLRNRLLRGYVAHANVAYLGSIALLTAIFLFVPLWASVQAGVSPLGLLVLALLAVIPVSEIAVTLLNRWVTQLLGPRHLPRLDLAAGIPSSMRTFVAVPTMLTNEQFVAESVQQLEIHYLSNPAGDVRFALLSDWMDADTETVAGDREIAGARGGRHRQAQPPLRPHERRRPALLSVPSPPHVEPHAGQVDGLGAQARQAARVQSTAARRPGYLFRASRRRAAARAGRRALCRHAWMRTRDCPSARYANWWVPPRIRSTRRAWIRPPAGWSKGYGLLQPRITPRLPSAHESSIFQRLFSAPSGVDAYAAAISDVYQDLFAQGSYTGKGLYDVDAFESALIGRLPEEAVLSHDLLEGIYARCALVSDIELFEDFPSHSEVSAARAHRWTRGDWQLLSWMFGRAGAGMSTIGRWKLIDNLRRSLVAPAALFTLLASWSIVGAPRLVWLCHYRARVVAAGARRTGHRSGAAAIDGLDAPPSTHGAGRLPRGVELCRGSDRAARQPCMAHDRRHRAHAVSHVRLEEAAARMGGRGARAKHHGPVARQLFVALAKRERSRHPGHRVRAVLQSGRLPLRGAVHRVVVGLASGGARDQLAAEGGRRPIRWSPRRRCRCVWWRGGPGASSPRS